MTDCRPTICVVTTRLSADEANPTLVDDLVAELAAQGAAVDVDVFDVEAPPLPVDDCRSFLAARVHNHGPAAVGPSRLPRAFQRAVWGARASRSIRRRLRNRHYDLTVYFGPAFLTLGTPGWVRRTKRTDRLIHVLWDFFPVHQVEIGRLPRGPQNELLRRLEVASMKHADTLILMTRRNAEFFADYYPELDPHVLIHPPWGRTTEADPKSRGSDGAFQVIFGGQLVRGRGVETLIAAAGLLADRGVDVEVHIVGSGPDREALQSAAESVPAVTFADRVPRRDYLQLLATAHCGVAVTVPDVSVPTFPSKIVDYTRMGLPVVVALENNSDAGPMVEASGAGMAVPAGDPIRLADAIEELVRERAAGTLAVRAAAARQFFTDQFDVAVVAGAIIAQAPGRG